MANSIWSEKFQRQISDALRDSFIAESRVEGKTEEQIAEELEVFDALAALRIKIGQDFLKKWPISPEL